MLMQLFTNYDTKSGTNFTRNHLAKFFSAQPHESRHKLRYVEGEIKRCDLGQKETQGGEGGEAALQRWDPENKSVEGGNDGVLF